MPLQWKKIVNNSNKKFVQKNKYLNVGNEPSQHSGPNWYTVLGKSTLRIRVKVKNRRMLDGTTRKNDRGFSVSWRVLIEKENLRRYRTIQLIENLMRQGNGADFNENMADNFDGCRPWRARCLRRRRRQTPPDAPAPFSTSSDFATCRSSSTSTTRPRLKKGRRRFRHRLSDDVLLFKLLISLRTGYPCHPLVWRVNLGFFWFFVYLLSLQQCLWPPFADF